MNNILYFHRYWLNSTLINIENIKSINMFFISSKCYTSFQMTRAKRAKSKAGMDPKKNPLYKGGKSYNPYELSLAVGYVKQKRMKMIEASRQYGIPYSTLKDHVNGKIKGNGKRGPDPTFNAEEEAAIVSYLQKMSQWGFSHSRADLRDLLKEFCDLKVCDFMTT